MAWNKNHFILTMDLLRAARSRAKSRDAINAIEELAEAFADTFEPLNNSFNRQRFLRGVGDSVSSAPPSPTIQVAAMAIDGPPEPKSEFLAAQRTYACIELDLRSAPMADFGRAEVLRQRAFKSSAIAASRARDAGWTLQELADANRELSADLAATAPKGTLYISVEAVAYHALVGDLLRKPALSQGLEVVPTQAQALLVKVKRAYSTRVVREAIGGTNNQQDALRALCELAFVS